ncbi:Dps family protein [Daejeonella sp.]|jgi:starvation-inducible DNA-binding protein|uniref:Dps family protein n=1 Tax=Daejeonella sp. TaxID=2805397 RepID=UPI003784E857
MENSLENNKINPLSDHLNVLLANYHIHYQKLRGCHWNVKGPHFFTLHLKFEELYVNAQLNIDALAERILTLGLLPYSTFTEYIKYSKLKEIDTVGMKDTDMVLAIMDDFSQLIEMEQLIMAISAQMGDDGTNDLLNTFMQFKEKTSWMLRSFIA